MSWLLYSRSKWLSVAKLKAQSKASRQTLNLIFTENEATN